MADINNIQEAAPIMEKKSHSGSIERSKIASRTAVYNILVIMSIVWIIPFILILLQSLRINPNPDAAVRTTSIARNIIPEAIGPDNYAALIGLSWDKVSGTFVKNSDLYTTFTYFGAKVSLPTFVGWFLNTFVIALFVAVFQTVIVLFMSYTLSRLRFAGRKLLMNFMLILGMFPGFLSMIILYYLLKQFGMTNANSVPGLILVSVASSGMGYYVSKGFFDTIPKSLDEAARIDGASRAQVLFKVILPLSKPIIIYTVLTAFMGPWGDFMFARLVAMGDNAGYNVAVGMQAYLSLDQISTKFTVFCAGGVCIAIPITILFLCLQRYYVEGVTGGAVKG